MATLPPKSKQQIREDTLAIIRGANPNAMNAAVPKLQIGIADMGSDQNVLGYVERSAPKRMVINELLSQIGGKATKNTVQHEFEHVLQFDAGSRYKKEFDSQVLEAYTAQGGSREKLISNLQRAGGSKTLADHIEKITGIPSTPYIGGMTGGQFSLKEQFAELSSIESASGKDLTKDPIVRKEFFADDQALIDTYKATTGMRTTRLDSKDLPPMTVQKTPPPAKVPSVLDQIVDIAKGLLK